jgi:cyclopropane fatty-acyl-phospholipid synthase-like methyltransferase
LSLPRHPRSATYDQSWALESSAGPNTLWLAEDLCGVLDLAPGSRVLELGCGNGSAAVFMAREYGVSVWALDNLFKPDEVAARVTEAGCGDRVFPMSINARSLPFPHRWFDAVVAVDSLQYFGTDTLYPRQIAKYIRPGGVFGAVIPGLTAEVEPEDLQVELTSIGRTQVETFHDAAWWQRHLARSSTMDVYVADLLPEAWRDCAEWYELSVRAEVGLTKLLEREAAVWRRDQGRELSIVRVAARVH